MELSGNNRPVARLGAVWFFELGVQVIFNTTGFNTTGVYLNGDKVLLPVRAPFAGIVPY
jgi:hypothetical protein